ANPEGGDGPIEVSMAFAWESPVEPPPALPDRAGEQNWRRIVRSLVVNPESLDTYRVAQPPLPSDLTIEPTDPRALVPGERSWGVIAIEQEGLYRIVRDDLVRAGLTEIQEGEIRLFSRGQPIPLL